MAQAPAVAKRLRAKHLMRAALAGGTYDTDDLIPSERAALRLRSERSAETWRAPDHVTFVIPLVGPDAVGDWEKVTALLNKTLDSLLRQTSAKWRAVICCQSTPPLPQDDRITHLPFDDPTPGNDKWRKLGRLYNYLATSETSPGLAMTFDADDLAAPELVDTLLASPQGALLTQGYVWDHANDRIAHAKPQSILAPGAKAFWKLCGSCAALPFDPTQASRDAQWAFLQGLASHEHRMIPYLARLSGQALASLADPLALYLLNHGENFGTRRGRITFKTRFTERFEIHDAEELERIRARFAIEPSREIQKTSSQD